MKEYNQKERICEKVNCKIVWWWGGMNFFGAFHQKEKGGGGKWLNGQK
jgi:hypothetical protein